MTLVIALKYIFGENNEAVLIASDAQATTPSGIQIEVKKIKEIYTPDGKPIAIISGAGNSAIIKWSFNLTESILLQAATNEYPLSENNFSSAVRNIESLYLRRMRELRNQGITPSFQSILGTVTAQGKALIYVFDRSGLAEPVHSDPGYSIIGRGFITGGVLLLKLLGYDPYNPDFGMLAGFILDAVSEVDASVGPFVGESYLMMIDPDNPEINGITNLTIGRLPIERIIEFRDKIRKRRDLIMYLWNVCETFGEDRIEDELDEIHE